MLRTSNWAWLSRRCSSQSLRWRNMPISGATPTTFWQGSLSGLGAPVTGLGHLAAVIAVGCLAAMQPRGEFLALGYVVASIVGAAAHIGEATLPNFDVYVALSVVMLGLMVFRKAPLRRDLVLALFVAAGLVNGYALGTTIAAARAYADPRLFHRAVRDPERHRARGRVRPAAADRPRRRCIS